MTDPTNPLAFPHAGLHGTVAHGMTLRDWFAGQALSAMRTRTYADYSVTDHQTKQPFRDRTHAAQAAYDYADAMLAARQLRD